MSREEYPQFQIREAMAIPGEGEMVEIVMWHNRNQANVFRMSKANLVNLEEEIHKYASTWTTRN